MNPIHYLFSFCLLIVLVGCVTSFESLKSELRPLSQDDGRIVFFGDNFQLHGVLAGGSYKPETLIDGIPIAHGNSEQQYFYADVSPGVHHITVDNPGLTGLKEAGLQSADLNVEVKSGETIWIYMTQNSQHNPDLLSLRMRNYYQIYELLPENAARIIFNLTAGFYRNTNWP